MKLFIDTNIFLDLLLDRAHSKFAKTLLLSIQEGLFEAVIADISLFNIDYIAKKQTQNIRQFITYINELITVVGADNKDIKQALLVDNDDFEDNLQMILAKKAHCDLIITNDLSFPSQELTVFSSQKFTETYL